MKKVRFCDTRKIALHSPISVPTEKPDYAMLSLYRALWYAEIGGLFLAVAPHTPNGTVFPTARKAATGGKYGKYAISVGKSSFCMGNTVLLQSSPVSVPIRAFCAPFYRAIGRVF